MRETTWASTPWIAAAVLCCALSATAVADDDAATDDAADRVVVYVDQDSFDVNKLRRLYDGRAELIRHVDEVHWRRLVGPSGRRFSAILLRVPESANVEKWLRKLSRIRGVQFSQAHRCLAPDAEPVDVPPISDPFDWNEAVARAQPALGQVNATPAAAIATGAGIRVAVLDGGFDTSHEFLDGVITSDSIDVIDWDTDPDDLGNGIDDDGNGYTDLIVGHGTFVAGLIHLCAEDAQIHAIRILDDEGRGTDLSLNLGLSQAVMAGADVINLSLRAPDISFWTKLTLQYAVSQDVVLVSAAGNDPNGPGDDPYLRSRSLTVGAVDAADQIVSWSPTDSWVDVFAPGGSPVVGPLGGATPNSWGTWWGSSFSTAFASAAVAMVRELEPGLSQQQVRDRVATEGFSVTGDPLSPARKCVDLLDVVDDL